MLQGIISVHLSKSETHSRKTQQSWFPSFTEELDSAYLYMYTSLPLATKGIVTMKQSKALLIIIPHISLVITNQEGQEPIAL
jgi:hypothetical protein